MTRTPTIVPAADFDPESDAKILKEAFRGLGSDEDAIMEVITKRSNEQRLAIASAFKTMYGKPTGIRTPTEGWSIVIDGERKNLDIAGCSVSTLDLIKELKSELRGNFEDIIIALMTTPIEFQAKQLHKAISGLGTDEATMVEILSVHDNEEVVKIAQAYEGLYQRSLESDIKGDTSGTVKRLLVSLSTGHRDESEETDQEKAFEDAQTLLRAGELFQGTEESTFNMILCQRNRSQLKLIFDEYENITGHPFETAIENEFSGTSKDSLISLIQSIRDRTDYLVTRLHDSMAGIGTDDRTLIRIIASRSEIDLGEIKDVFEQKYGTTLEEFIKDDCSGDYKKSLLAVVAGNL